MKDSKFTEVKNENKKDVKSTQDKIILITRITGVILFLIGIAIIFIVSIIKSKTPQEVDGIKYTSTSENFMLQQEDKNILEEQYYVLDSMEDYNKILTMVDNWYQESLTNYTSTVNEYTAIDEDRKQELIDEYKDFNDQRYDDIKSYLNKQNITEDSFKEKSIIVIEDVTGFSTLQNHELVDVCANEGMLNIYLTKEYIGVVADVTSSIYLITVDKTYGEYTININVDHEDNSEPMVSYKPIIYIYPEEETNVRVKLGYKENLLVSYPVYEEEWNVLAKPDGTLIDNKTNRELYSLYYESKNKVEFKVEEDGFVISKDEIIPFLEEKLELLGLNPREQEEFIIYWLPILQKNEYTYIRFATQEEIDENMPLNVEPKPQTTIRVLMTFKGLENKISVKEQQLQKVSRNGYTVVEWGATIIE